MNRLLSICICLVITLSACKKDNTPKEKEKRPSTIQTVSIQTPDPTSIIVAGKITKGDYQITEYGFLYGASSELKKENATVVKVGSNIEEGTFTKEIQNLAPAASALIYVCAYFIDENGTTYGQSLSSERPVFERGTVSPMYGKTEDRISIKGKFYNPRLQDLSVTFSDVSAKIESFSDTEIIAVVPKGIPQIHGQRVVLNITNRGVKSELTDDFEILAHVYDYSPKEGAIGTVLSFEGDNLQLGRYAPVNVPIYFGDIQAAFHFTDNFNVLAPMTVPSATMPVYVSIKGVKTKLPGDFTLLSPVITEIAPKSGLAGMYFRIKLDNFPIAPGQNALLGGKLGNIPVAMDVGFEQINVMTPSDIPPGDYVFTFRPGPFTVTFSEKITILSGVVTSMSPTSGFFGQAVKLNGTFLHGKTYDIYINGKPYAAVRCSENGRIDFGLGYDLPEGDAEIAVNIGGKIITAGKFKMIHSKISSMSPASGSPGTTVILKALDNSFNHSHSSPNVYFGDVKVTGLNSVNVTDREISVKVPANAKPGRVKIRLSYGEYDVLSPDFFEVLP